MGKSVDSARATSYDVIGGYHRFMTKPIPHSWEQEIAGWSAALRAAGREESSIRTRSDHLRWLAGWADERGPWDLELEDLQAWMGSHGWARNTRRGVRASLRSFYTWGISVGRIGTSPADDLPAVRPGAPAPHPTPNIAYEEALRRGTPRERLMLRLAAECGMRRAEVAQVHSRDLIFDLRGSSLLVHGKGGKQRIVPLRPGLAAALQEAGPGWLFPGDDDGHLSPRWVGKLIAQLLPGDWTMHSLRHRFATQAYSIDRDVFSVQELLGHASPATTRLYVRLPDDAKRRIIDAMDKLDGDVA